MTPFKIRQRIRRLFGMDKAATASQRPPPRPRVQLVVIDQDGAEQAFDGNAGDTPLFISGNMEKPIGSGCNDSTCATCRIEVLAGAENLAPQSERERKTLRENGHPETLRLACRAEILRDAVRVRAHEFLEL